MTHRKVSLLKSLRPLHVTLLGFLVTTLVLAPVSHARTTRAYEMSFGAFGTALAGAPASLAVDQSNGDVYAFDKGKVHRFTAAGGPKNFTTGPGAGASVLTGFGSSGSIAIDNSGGSLDGTIYVVNETNHTIDLFAASGTPLGAINGSTTLGGIFDGGRNPTDVAVDQSDGSLYIALSPQPEVWRYAPSSPGGAIDDADYEAATGISAFVRDGLAANSGDIYGIGSEFTSQPLRRYSSSDFTPAAPTAEGVLIDDFATAVAVDPKTGDIYANEGNGVAVFNAAGVPLYRFGAAAYFGVNSQGIAVKSSPSGPATKAYVSDPTSNHEIDVFGVFAKVLSYTHDTLASFGPAGTSASSFFLLENLSFEQGEQKLYALDYGDFTDSDPPPGFYGFDVTSPPAFPLLAGFDPHATAPLVKTSFDRLIAGLAIDNTALASAGNVYIASQSTDLLYGFNDSGADLAGFPVDPAISPGAPNGAPKNLCGAAVDSAGNIWVANSATKRILEYSSTSTYLSAIDTSTQGGPCQLAFDSADNLYATFDKGVFKYTAASGYATAIQVMSLTSFGVGIRSLSIAVDPSNDHLYVASSGSCGGNCLPDLSFESWVDEYNAAGSLIDEFLLSKKQLRGITLDSANGNVYVSVKDQIQAIGPGYLLPEAKTKAATDLTNTTATLNGEVITQGVALTDCAFEYVSLAAFRLTGFSNLSSGGSVACDQAPGSLPLDLDEHSVSASATGLTKNTEYRFRVLASNADGDVQSEVAAFTSASPPLAETTGTPIRSATTAQLGARVNPSRAPTTYRFEYGTEGPCDINPCAVTPDRDAGSGDLEKLVSEEISGLQPSTTYHYRVIADNGNSDGPAVGEDMTVATHASDAPLDHGHYPGPPGSDRAWEQVNLPDTGGNATDGVVPFDIGRGEPAISEDGEHVLYSVVGGTPLAESGSGGLYQADRDPVSHPTRGWQTHLAAPPRGELLEPEVWAVAATNDFSELLVANFDDAGKLVLWRLSRGSPAAKLFETVPPQRGLEGQSSTPIAGSADLATVVASLRGGTLDPAYPTAAASNNLYDVASGVPELVSTMPEGGPSPCGAEAPLIQSGKGMVFAAGTRVVFASQGAGPCGKTGAPFKLYVRDLAIDQTRLISTPPVSGPACPAVFTRAVADTVFFWSQSRLTAGDTTPDACSTSTTPLDGDIYRYDLGDDALDCLTCLYEDLDADVTADVGTGSFSPNNLPTSGPSQIAVSEDGSRIYFTSSAHLLPGTPPAGQTAVYRLAVATGNLAFVAAPGLGINIGMAQLSADGSQLLFRSADSSLNPLGGTDNGATEQWYRYYDADRSLVCVSCPSDGALPGGKAGNAALAEEGTIAFSTPTPLVGPDQNTPGSGGSPAGGTDIYEWREGRHLLVTDGLTEWMTGVTPKVNAISPSGRDLFFTTANRRYTQDALDSLPRLYDARIGGGIDFPVTPPPCPLEVCQGTPKGAPSDLPPGTIDFSGRGNVSKPAPRDARRCPKGKRRVRRAGKTRCVKRRGRANPNRRAHR